MAQQYKASLIFSTLFFLNFVFRADFQPHFQIHQGAPAPALSLVEGPASGTWETKRRLVEDHESGCPTLAASLFLRQGWETTNFNRPVDEEQPVSRLQVTPAMNPPTC
jgi:hypothetical protein